MLPGVSQRPLLADCLGVPTYLETFAPRNLTFYQCLGYEAIDSFVEPVSNARYWIMDRPAGSPTD